MDARDAFGVAVRVAGGWQILRAFDAAYYVVVKAFGFATGSTLPIQVDINALMFSLIVGCLLLSGASRLVALVYGRAASS
jgi:hypothetical protein